MSNDSTSTSTAKEARAHAALAANVASHPLQSQQVKVLDSYLHYTEVGSGKPMLFLHGMPTSCYVWRKIMPEMAAQRRCIAVDLIGMGASGKPDIQYTTAQHMAYIDAFIEALQLEDITLVLHGWGSVLGFDYAKRNPQNIAGLVFYEAHVRAATDWSMLSLPVQQLASMLSHPQASKRAVIQKNFMIEELLPSALMGELQLQDIAAYRQPFTEAKSRQPLWQYLLELPLDEQVSDDLRAVAPQVEKFRQQTLQRIMDYSAWLQQTDLPKLMLYAMPGFNTTMDTVAWCQQHLPNLTAVVIEDALHFAQESQPQAFAVALGDWLYEQDEGKD